MIAAHEDSWCEGCDAWTLGPSCNWCERRTVRYSPAIEAARARHYARFRRAGIAHEDALELIDLVRALVERPKRRNDHLVRALVVTSRERKDARPLISRAPVAVAA